MDVEARTDDHFLGTSDDVQALAIEARKIAGIEPALSVDNRCGQLGGTIVAEHHVTPPDMQPPNLTSRRRNAVECSDPRLYSRQHSANRLVGARRIEAHARYPRRTFGDPVAVEQRTAELFFHARLQIQIKAGACNGARAQPASSL